MLDSILASGLTLPAFLICTAVSLVLGIATAFLSMYRSKCSQGFAVTVAVLPAIVQIVILLVNGNVGAGVAVAGAFSLVRFRSVPGTAREIGVIFLAMALGLATGMGYVTLAAVFFVIIAAMLLLLTRLDFGTRRTDERLLKITIPENLDYELHYRVTLRDAQVPKAFFDALRCRNGNLNISCGREQTGEAL